MIVTLLAGDKRVGGGQMRYGSGSAKESIKHSLNSIRRGPSQRSTYKANGAVVEDFIWNSWSLLSFGHFLELRWLFFS